MLSRTSLVMLFVVLAICPAAQGATLKTLYSFCSASNCADGAEPDGGLLLDGNGNLFGTAFLGGTAPPPLGHGVAFELSPGRHGTWQFTNLHTFCTQNLCPDGQALNGDLIIDAAGNLYGDGAGGGSLGHGLIFELSPAGASWSFADLHDFTDTDGMSPTGGLRYVGFGTGAPYDGTSSLFGMTVGAGPGGGGTVYQFTPSAGSWTLTTLHGFSNDPNGYSPIQSVTLDATGANIYGPLLLPDGGVFRLTDAGGGAWNETTLYTFSPSTGDDTFSPFSTLILDSSGSLIGTTADGGPHCKYKRHDVKVRCGGGVFKLSGGSSNPTYTAIHDFCAKDKLCTDGARPGGSLVMDASGTLYGITASGGKYGSGTIFRIRRESKIEVIYDFCGLPNCSDGASPSGGLILDASGRRLYGVTSMGGADNQGTIFELTP
jgi:uncharacterized repeat protein (TIGR03803 family)